jgi:hypothetical protein
MHSRSSISIGARVAAAGLVAALAACGGKTDTNTTPSGGGPTDGDDTAASLDQDRVQAELAELAVPDACGGPDAAANLGALLDDQQALIGDDAERAFECREGGAAGGWACTWSALTSGGSGYQIMVDVTDDGELVADSVACLAPG